MVFNTRLEVFYYYLYLNKAISRNTYYMTNMHNYSMCLRSISLYEET